MGDSMNEQNDRRRIGMETWTSVKMTRVAPPSTPLLEAGLDFVAAEVWTRPGLSRKERRWITLSCLGMAGLEQPLQGHVRSALASGDITKDELMEFALHIAVYGGFPRAAVVQSVIDESAQ